MKPKAAKAIPFIAGFFILLLLAGFSLGLRTVMEFDPINAQMKTSKYIYIYLPVIIHKQELWFSDGTAPTTPIDWQLMHAFHQSAAGSKIEHTHWGSIADTIIPWGDLDLEPDSKSRLAERTRALITSGRPVKPLRISILHINAMLNYRLDTPDTNLSPQDIDTIIDDALAKPIDNEASMIPDP